MGDATQSGQFVYFEGRRYDVRKWIAIHPGGDVITPFIGQDVTCALHMQHDTSQPRFRKQMKAIDAGEAPDHPISAFDADYIALESLFVDKGWFKPNLWWYLYKAAWVVALLAAAAWFENPWASGAFFGLFIQQSAFLGHDICHRAAVPARYRRMASWFFGSICFGLSHDKWVREHNTHHMLVSRPLQDPQMNTMPDMVYAEREIEHFERVRRPLTNWEKTKMAYQFVWLLPVLLLYGRVIICRRDIKTAIEERSVPYAMAYTAHYSLWVALMIKGSFVTGTPLYFCGVFILMTLMVAGLIHLQLILSHAYSPRLFAEEQHELGMRTQIVSNQNITTTLLDDWFHGGLQHHIEHHLFPRLPRHSLPKVRPHVKKLCEDHGLAYRSDPFFVCIYDLFKSLHRQGRNLRAELRGAAQAS